MPEASSLNCPSPRLCAVLGIFLATAVAAADSGLQSVQGAADVVDRVINVSRIYALVDQYFAHWEGVPRTDFEAAYRDYVEHAVRAETRKAFSLATLAVLAADHHPLALDLEESKLQRPTVQLVLARAEELAVEPVRQQIRR